MYLRHENGKSKEAFVHLLIELVAVCFRLIFETVRHRQLLLQPEVVSDVNEL